MNQTKTTDNKDLMEDEKTQSAKNEASKLLLAIWLENSQIRQGALNDKQKAAWEVK